jgi:hypothetical protein
MRRMHDSAFMTWNLPNSVAADHQNPINNTLVHASQTVKPLHVLEAVVVLSCLMSCQMATPSDHAQIANSEH